MRLKALQRTMARAVMQPLTSSERMQRTAPDGQAMRRYAERFFVLEVMVERTLRSARGHKQGLDAQVVVPMLQEHAPPRIEQALLGCMRHLKRASPLPSRSCD